MPSTFRNPKKLLKLPETALNCPKLHEIGLHQIAPNCPKLLQIAKKNPKVGQIYPKLPQIHIIQIAWNWTRSIFTSTTQRFELLSTPAIVHQNTSCHRHSKSHVLHQFTRRYRAFRSRARDCPCTLSDVNTSILASGNASYSGFAWTTLNGHPAEPDILFRRCTQMCHCHCHYTTLQRLMLSTSSQMYQDRFPFPSF